MSEKNNLIHGMCGFLVVVLSIGFWVALVMHSAELVIWWHGSNKLPSVSQRNIEQVILCIAGIPAAIYSGYTAMIALLWPLLLCVGDDASTTPRSTESETNQAKRNSRPQPGRSARIRRAA